MNFRKKSKDKNSLILINFNSLILQIIKSSTTFNMNKIEIHECYHQPEAIETLKLHELR